MARRGYLWVIAALVIVANLLPGCTGEKQQIKDVGSQEAFNLMQDKKDKSDFIILDVRTASEFAAGHIAGAINIDVNLPSFREEMGKLDKRDIYLIYCGSGKRSRNALAVMEELGFTRIYHLVNGITEWISLGLPVVQ